MTIEKCCDRFPVLVGYEIGIRTYECFECGTVQVEKTVIDCEDCLARKSEE